MKTFEVVAAEGEEAAVLKVRARRLELRMREEFLAATGELLARPERRLIVDVSNLPRLFSLFIGALVDLHLRAEQTGRSLTIIASPAVAEQLRKMSLDQKIRIEQYGPPGG